MESDHLLIFHLLKLLSPMDGVGSPFSCPSSPGRCSPTKTLRFKFFDMFRLFVGWQERLPHLRERLRATLNTQNPLTHPQWRTPLQVFPLADVKQHDAFLQVCTMQQVFQPGSKSNCTLPHPQVC